MSVQSGFRTRARRGASRARPQPPHDADQLSAAPATSPNIGSRSPCVMANGCLDMLTLRHQYIRGAKTSHLAKHRIPISMCVMANGCLDMLTRRHQYIRGAKTNHLAKHRIPRSNAWHRRLLLHNARGQQAGAGAPHPPPPPPALASSREREPAKAMCTPPRRGRACAVQKTSPATALRNERRRRRAASSPGEHGPAGTRRRRAGCCGRAGPGPARPDRESSAARRARGAGCCGRAGRRCAAPPRARALTRTRCDEDSCVCVTIPRACTHHLTKRRIHPRIMIGSPPQSTSPSILIGHHDAGCARGDRRGWPLGPLATRKHAPAAPCHRPSHNPAVAAAAAATATAAACAKTASGTLPSARTGT